MEGLDDRETEPHRVDVCMKEQRDTLDPKKLMPRHHAKRSFIMLSFLNLGGLRCEPSQTRFAWPEEARAKTMALQGRLAPDLSIKRESE